MTCSFPLSFPSAPPCVQETFFLVCHGGERSSTPHGGIHLNFNIFDRSTFLPRRGSSRRWGFCCFPPTLCWSSSPYIYFERYSYFIDWFLSEYEFCLGEISRRKRDNSSCRIFDLSETILFLIRPIVRWICLSTLFIKWIDNTYI